MAGSDDRSSDAGGGGDSDAERATPPEDASGEGNDRERTRKEEPREAELPEEEAQETEAEASGDAEGSAMSTPLGDGADLETDADESETRTPYLLGLSGGVAAWLLGYLVVYLASSDRIRGSIGGQLLNELAGDDATWKLVGWLFFNAHFVDVVFDAPVLGVRVLDLIAQYGGSSTYLYAVPPAFLLAAGLLVGYRTGSEGLGDAAVTGFLLVPGYLLLSAAGALLFAVGGGNATAAPDLVTAVLLAGLVYPALFGAVGSALGDQL